MRRAATAIFALALLGGCAAQSSPDPIPGFTKYHLDVEASRSGEIRTEVDLAYDFLDDTEEESHGVYLLINTYREIDGDKTRDRYTPVISWSANDLVSGEPLRAQGGKEGTYFYFGDEDRTVTGLHEYGMAYTMEGIVDSGTGPDGGDEVYWNIVGHEFDDPIEDIEIDFTGPGPILTAECWAGPAGSSDPCAESLVDGPDLSISHDRLEPGEGITIALGFEPGAFAPQEAQYVSNPPPGLPGWVYLILSLSLAGLGGIASYSIVAWRYRDDKYLGEIPGLEPAAPTTGRIGRAGILPPRPAVSFMPPVDVTPGQAAALMNPSKPRNIIQATILALAVRGCLTITTVDKGIELEKVKDQQTADLSPSERFVFSTLFSDGDTLRIVQPKPEVPLDLTRTPGMVIRELMDNSWLKSDHDRAHRILRWTSIIGFFPLIIIAGQMAKSEDWQALSVIAAPVGFFAGIGLSLDRLRRRTASGYARYTQTVAFKKYLAKAEAHRLQFEADAGVFSRYLPYAMALGIVTKWVSAFEDQPGSLPYTYPWFNGGTVSLVAGSAALGALYSGLGGAGAVWGYSGGVTVGGGGSVGGGLGGGGGGRW